MPRSLLLVVVLVLAAALPSRGQTPPTPPTPPVYDVKVELDHSSTGTTTFVVDEAGKVTGTLHIDTPDVVNATLAGTIKDGTWTYEYPFSMPDQNCTGTASGTAKVTADRSSVSGTVNISGECAPQPMSGSFTFTKQPK